MNSARMILKYWWKSPRKFTLALVLQLASTFFQLLIPVFIGRLVGRLSPTAANPLDARGLWMYFLAIVLVGGVAYFIFRWSRFLVAEIASWAMYNLRKDIHDAIYRQSFAYFDKHETGQLVARATSDVEQTDQIFGMALGMGLQGVVVLIGVIASVSFLQTSLAWVYAVLIPLSLGSSVLITKKLRPAYVESREAFGELTNTIRENIVGAQVVRMFNTQDKERGKFSKNNRRFLDASVRATKYNSLYMPVNVVIISLMVGVTLLVGGMMVIGGTMELGVLVTLQSYTGMAIFPLVMIGQIMIVYVQADAALQRIAEVIESAPEIVEDPNPVPASSIRGEVEFDRVSFGYTPSHRVLKDLSFTVAAGEKLAILGTTGSGKTTIINLIPRFYDVTSGAIRVDGVDIRRYKLSEYRRNIAIVSQDTFLFNKSVRENITFGREGATMEEVVEAARIANIHDFIASLPEGYETVVGERGTRLSGGQKQRLSIARAIIVKPKILVLDDSTSSVDVETEFKIQQALDNIMRDCTTFIITQRISTIRNADRIMVLDKGRVVGLGTHEELVGENVLYRQIYETLFRKQKRLVGGTEVGRA
ncbi:MAG: ABC transporter ATP-binding protein [Promethearchaeota archaeon]